MAYVPPSRRGGIRLRSLTAVAAIFAVALMAAVGLFEPARQSSAAPGSATVPASIATGTGTAAAAPATGNATAIVPAPAVPADDAGLSYAANEPLAVSYTQPATGDVEIDPQAVIYVQFNRPVATLTAIARRSDQQVLSFDPPAGGAGKWLTSALYTFKPDPGLQPSTTYTVRVRADLSDQPDGTLAAPYDFSFTTIVPAVAETAPRDNSQFVDPAAGVRVTFNQAVDRASAQAAFSLVAGGVSVAGAFSWPDDSALLFQPAASLARGTTFTATVAAGVSGAAGDGVSTKEYAWTFTVVEVPRVRETRPANGETAANLGAVTITFTGPMDHNATEAAITIEPKPTDDLEPNFYWSGDTQLNISFSMKYASSYRVGVGAGAEDRYGMPIAVPYALSYTTMPQPQQQPQPPRLSLIGFGQETLNAYLPVQIYLQSVNERQVDFALYPIPAEDFRLADSDFQQRNTYVPRNPALKTWTFAIPDFQSEQVNVSLVTLGDALPSGGTLAPGFYLLDAGKATQPLNQEHDRAFLEVTRTNLVVKRGVDSGLVWAADMQTGAPVAGAAVSFSNSNGGVLATGTTAADGTFSAALPHPEQSGLPARIYANVQRPDDVALANQDWTGSAGPYSFNVPVSLYPPVTQRGYLYTDRPIYRAGETVHIRFIVRTDDDGRYSVPAGADMLNIQATDSRGNPNSVPSAQAQLDGFGSLGADLVIPAEAATGNYQINVRLGSSQVGSGSFLVAEFRVPEFTVKLDTDHAEYISGATISATAQADLFFGAHLPDAALDWRVNGSPYSFRPQDKQYNGFSFSDFELAQQAQPIPFPVASGNATTDIGGSAPFSVPARLGDYPASERYTITATITDQNRQQVSTSKDVIVHRAQQYAGLRPQQYLITAGKTATLDVASVDTAGSPAGSVPLHIEAYRRIYKTTKEKQPDGSTRFVSTQEDTLVDSRNLTTDQSGRAAYSFVPAAGGQYRITVAGVDAAGNPFQAATFIYATSTDFTPWRVNSEPKLDLVADKEEYVPGDIAHVLVPAPFAGATGLVTVERGRIFTYATQQFPTNSTVVDIPITADMAPTVYLGVALFKPGQAADDVPGYQVGYLKLPVSAAAHALTISLTPDKPKLGPGETVNVTVRTTDSAGRGVPAEVSLAMVDQAVLSLANDRDTSIFDYFWGPRSLGVGTGSTQGVSLNTANRAQAAQPPARTATPAPPPPPPAATAAARPAAQAPISAPVVRSDFQNTAYWKADVRTDASGTTTVSIRMPDNLTTWRLAARGTTVDTSVGETQTSILTTKDLVMRPVAPRFFTAGDQVRLEALITNNSSTPLDVTVSLAVEGVTLSSGNQQRITVPPGQAGKAAWDTVAGEATGAPAKLLFTAQAASGQSDAVSLNPPINERSTPETVASSGIVTGDSVQETVQVPGFARQDKGDISVQLNGSLSGVIKQASIYLERYYYEPADVTAARLLDRTAAMQTAIKLQQPQNVQDDARTVAEGAVRRLLFSQRGDGGWAWWPGCCSLSSPQITAQVLYALGAAEQAGLAVDAPATANGARYLVNIYDRPQDVLYPADPNARAFWLAAMAATGNGSPDREAQLFDLHRTLSDSGKGALLQALVNDGTPLDDPSVRALVSELTSTAIASASGTHWEDADGFYAGYANSTRATALVLAGLVREDPNQPLLDGGVRWLSNARANGYWRSIGPTALSINAIAAFIVAREQPLEALTFAVNVNGRPIGSGAFDPAVPGYTALAGTTLTGLPVDTDIPVTIDKGGSGQLYYSLYMRYFSPTDDVPALSNGISVGRELLPQDSDSAATTFQAGDLVRVHLTIVADSDLQFVQVEDFLPAGLEAIDSSLKTTDPNLTAQQRQQQGQLQQGSRAGGLPSYYYFSPFDHVEVRDDRVALFATTLSRGIHEYIYFARATTAGTFMEPPAVAVQTDFPDVFGRSDNSVITISP